MQWGKKPNSGLSIPSKSFFYSYVFEWSHYVTLSLWPFHLFTALFEINSYIMHCLCPFMTMYNLDLIAWDSGSPKISFLLLLMKSRGQKTDSVAGIWSPLLKLPQSRIHLILIYLIIFWYKCYHIYDMNAIGRSFILKQVQHLL